MKKKPYRHVPKVSPRVKPEEAIKQEKSLRIATEAWAWYVSGRRPLPRPPKRTPHH